MLQESTVQFSLKLQYIGLSFKCQVVSATQFLGLRIHTSVKSHIIWIGCCIFRLDFYLTGRNGTDEDMFMCRKRQSAILEWSFCLGKRQETSLNSRENVIFYLLLIYLFCKHKPEHQIHGFSFSWQMCLHFFKQLF